MRIMKIFKITTFTLIVSFLFSVVAFAAPGQGNRGGFSSNNGGTQTQQSVAQNTQPTEKVSVFTSEGENKKAEIRTSQGDIQNNQIAVNKGIQNALQNIMKNEAALHNNALEISEILEAPRGLEGINIKTQKANLNKDVLRQTEEGQTTEDLEVSYDYVEILGAVTQEEYDYFAYYLELVDNNILEDFQEEDWTIILTSADLDDLLFGGTTDGVMGCIYFVEETIYINSGTYSYCIIHEMGHYMDYYYDFTSNTEDFYNIYREEANFHTLYGQTSVEEFFAEVYMYSILEQEAIKAACPLAYAYVKECVYNLN